MASATPQMVPPGGQHALLNYLRTLPERLRAMDRRVLNLLLRSLTDRGWMPSATGLLTQMEGEVSEPELRDTIGRLVHLRMLEVDQAGETFTGLLGGLTSVRTSHRAHLTTGIDIYAQGGLELISLHALTTYEAHCSTTCGRCQAPIRFVVNGEGIASLSPPGLAAFHAAWDGVVPIEQVHASSPVFCADGCLDAWQDAHPSNDGLPLSSQIFAMLAAEMASNSGGLRFMLVEIEG